MAVKLCFGVRIDAARMAASIGAHYGKVKYATCPFCGANGVGGNFCSNCGTDVRKGLAEIGPGEVVELVMSQHYGEPPRPLALVAHGQSVCVCQVLSSSDDGLAEASRAPRHYQWEEVASVIRGYVAKFGVMDAEPKLFAIAN